MFDQTYAGDANTFTNIKRYLRENNKFMQIIIICMRKIKNDSGPFPLMMLYKELLRKKRKKLLR